ncbi:MAG: mycofactocin-coupled SDR family oxidoreductase [Rhodococcus fascians]
MGRLDGKVALVSGAARGQGRSHAVRLAEEGADIIAFDVCEQMANVPYPMSTESDLDTTAGQVEALDRRVVAGKVDVRDSGSVVDFVSDAVGRLGRLDVVVANAGIAPMGNLPTSAFLDVVQVNLNGVVNTIAAATPYLSTGASVVAIGSVAGLRMGRSEDGSSSTGPGGAGYGFSKRAVAALVHSLARELGRDGIRVNAIHPTNVATPMLLNSMMFGVFAPGSDDPSYEEADPGFRSMHVLDVPYVEAQDVSNAVVFLASDESRMITGQQLKVDAGCMLSEPYQGA